MKEKALKIQVEYNMACYMFPTKFKDMDEFVKYLSDYPNNFVKLTKLSENTCFPYFIEEDSRDVYLRLSQKTEIIPFEATILKKAEYIARLSKLVDTVCTGCMYYSNEKENLGEIGNLRGHWTQISLDGYCDGFYRKEEDEHD